MKVPKSFTGTIHLPDARLNFHLSFGDKETKAGNGGNEAKLMGEILTQALESSPESRQLLDRFLDYLKRSAETSGQSRKE